MVVVFIARRVMKVASLKEEGWTFDCDREETAEREFGAILALSG
jgi:hypothetical protein